MWAVAWPRDLASMAARIWARRRLRVRANVILCICGSSLSWKVDLQGRASGGAIPGGPAAGPCWPPAATGPFAGLVTTGSAGLPKQGVVIGPVPGPSDLVFTRGSLVPVRSLPEVVTTKVAARGSLEPARMSRTGKRGCDPAPGRGRLVSTHLGRCRHGRRAVVDHAVDFSRSSRFAGRPGWGLLRRFVRLKAGASPGRSLNAASRRTAAVRGDQAEPGVQFGAGGAVKQLL